MKKYLVGMSQLEHDFHEIKKRFTALNIETAQRIGKEPRNYNAEELLEFALSFPRLGIPINRLAEELRNGTETQMKLFRTLDAELAERYADEVVALAREGCPCQCPKCAQERKAVVDRAVEIVAGAGA